MVVRAARHTKRTALLAPLTLAVLLLTACGPEEEDRQDVGAAHSGGPSASSGPPTPPPPSPSPALTAADGDDVAACADGDCEVVVSGPVVVRFDGPGGAATLSVTEVGRHKVAYSVKSGAGRSQGSASGPGHGCLTVLRANGSGNSCGRLAPGRPERRQDAVVVQLTAAAGGSALLHIVSP
ncbi:hypothetical protein [Streptomyces sp. Da 82-17]|uniref:hypothetical protein n=1 Tax=Streptomyces sp. Da 82-17 TaxID=3377116 RepID=UPI0038D36E0E